jgi:hypothetical protein
MYKYADSERFQTTTAYLRAWYTTENKQVPHHNIGVPPVRK